MVPVCHKITDICTCNNCNPNNVRRRTVPTTHAMQYYQCQIPTPYNTVLSVPGTHAVQYSAISAQCHTHIPALRSLGPALMAKSSFLSAAARRARTFTITRAALALRSSSSRSFRCFAASTTAIVAFCTTRLKDKSRQCVALLTVLYQCRAHDTTHHQNTPLLRGFHDRHHGILRDTTQGEKQANGSFMLPDQQRLHTTTNYSTVQSIVVPKTLYGNHTVHSPHLACLGGLLLHAGGPAEAAPG